MKTTTLIASWIAYAGTFGAYALAADDPPTPQPAPYAKHHPTHEQKQDQRIRDLSKRIDDTERVADWIRRCLHIRTDNDQAGALYVKEQCQ